MPVSPKLILAPLRGVTQLAFRTCIARHFPGFDEAYSPFLTTVSGNKIKATHLQDVMPAANAGLPLVPQVIGKSPEAFRTLLLALRDIGYERCDLNAGCPWPMIVKRGRGAGLLADAGNLEAMLEVGCEVLGKGLSLKVRLGLDTPDLLAKRMELVNGFPLAALTIHARTARQMYEGSVDLESFSVCLGAAKMPVVYNGDIFTPEDLARLQARFPGVAAWMIGRGAIRDPALPSRIRGALSGDVRGKLADFVRDYSECVKAQLCGPAPFLGRMKEFWSYFKDGIEGGEEIWRKLRLARTYAEYDAAIAPLR